jgi:hypothetical protein
LRKPDKHDYEEWIEDHKVLDAEFPSASNFSGFDETETAE